MEQTRTYRVEHAVAGLEAGAKVTDGDLPAGLNVEALIKGGFLTVDSAELLICEACAALGKERKAKNPETLRKHYEKDHPGLVAPTEGREE